jgi:hypothetical protein
MRSRGRLYVPEHDANHAGPLRVTLADLLAAVGLWDRLPARVLGVLCGCPICRGEEQPPNDRAPGGGDA